VEGGVGAEVGVQEAHKKSFPVLRHMPARPPAKPTDAASAGVRDATQCLISSQQAAAAAAYPLDERLLEDETRLCTQHTTHTRHTAHATPTQRSQRRSSSQHQARAEVRKKIKKKEKYRRRRRC
jgi:hypothetical protein